MCGKTMPDCRAWFEKYLGLSTDYRTPSQSRSELVAPDPIDNQAFIDYLRSNNISFSNAPQYRIVRSHGHTGSY
ncbi:unnamed protein product [Anisakis simplex]|uniref:Alkylglycerone-phosphate synthase n=1 Tax=Anisakis simplex TaxID=6269 RepID=A0A0M3KHP7_ANISI|nr:unnamed protein product [Anisakis simplex]